MAKPQKFAPFGGNEPGGIPFDLLWNFEDPVLMQALSYRRKIAYYISIYTD